MEGNPVIKDEEYAHDHTYYGNGCPNDWNNPTGGSTVACSTNLVTTFGEVQAIGVYYDYLAATTGSGGPDSLKNNNENSPDTFCPLGWQLPYSGTDGDYYDQSKSFRYLKSMYLSPGDTEPDIGKKGLKYPMSFARTGIYVTSKGGLALMGVASYLTTITNYTRFAGYKSTVYDDAFSAFAYQDKRDSESVRCDFDISNLEIFPWHPRSLISIMAFHFLKAHFPSVKIMSNYLKNETKYFIFMELRANFDEAESKYKMENRILMSE